MNCSYNKNIKIVLFIFQDIINTKRKCNYRLEKCIAKQGKRGVNIVYNNFKTFYGR